MPLGDRSHCGGPRREAVAFSILGNNCRTRRCARHQHLFTERNRHCRKAAAPGTLHGAALLQPCPLDGLGGSCSCPANRRRACGPSQVHDGRLGQVSCGDQRHARLHRQSSGSAVLWRSVADFRGRIGVARDHRCGHAQCRFSNGSV